MAHRNQLATQEPPSTPAGQHEPTPTQDTSVANPRRIRLTRLAKDPARSS